MVAGPVPTKAAVKAEVGRLKGHRLLKDVGGGRVYCLEVADDLLSPATAKAIADATQAHGLKGHLMSAFEMLLNEEGRKVTHRMDPAVQPWHVPSQITRYKTHQVCCMFSRGTVATCFSLHDFVI